MSQAELMWMSQRERDRLKVLHEVRKGPLRQKQAAAQLGLTDRWVRKLLERLRSLAAERRRFGYRRLTVLLRREGWAVKHKRVHRL